MSGNLIDIRCSMNKSEEMCSDFLQSLPLPLCLFSQYKYLYKSLECCLGTYVMKFMLVDWQNYLVVCIMKAKNTGKEF